MSHELEAERGEVQVKKAEVKKLSERLSAMKQEHEFSERQRVTAERRMVGFHSAFLLCIKIAFP